MVTPFIEIDTTEGKESLIDENDVWSFVLKQFVLKSQILLINTTILRGYYVPDTILGTRNTRVNKTDDPNLTELASVSNSQTNKYTIIPLVGVM